MRSLLFLILLSGANWSLSQALPIGKVIDTVKTKIEGQTYALYLPVGYKEEKAYPVIFFFEPLARGALPLELYKSLADKYELILTCSNNSKNYTSAYLSFDAADAMMKDVFARFQINNDLVITSGFSGGSRVAIAVASQNFVVKGIIGIGAVGPIYPDHNLKKQHQKPYAGLVGDQDFNYVEHYRGEEQFKKEGIDNIRLVFNRAHQWAPVADYEMALLWMLSKLDANLRDELLDVSLIESYLGQLKDSVSVIDAYRTKRYYTLDFDLQLDWGLADPSTLDKAEKKLEKTIALESKLRKQYGDSLMLAFRMPPNRNVNTPLNWIIQTGNSHSNKAIQSRRKNPMRAEMYDRLSNFIRASAYEHVMEAMVNRDFNRGYIGLEIWSSMIDNEIWENWMKCKFYALHNDVSKAAGYLSRLIKLGFENGKAIKADSTFDVLSNTTPYQQLIAEIDP